MDEVASRNVIDTAILAKHSDHIIVDEIAFLIVTDFSRLLKHLVLPSSVTSFPQVYGEVTARRSFNFVM